MKKILLIMGGIAIISCLFIVVLTNNNFNNDGIEMKEVNLENLDELIIGSEPPKLLYADDEKVIFDCNGIFIYDMKDKIISRSFDALSVDSERTEKRKWNSFVSNDGKYIIFIIAKGTSYGSVDRYIYSFEDDLVTEIDEKEYLHFRSNAFKWTDLEYNNDLYEKASGRIVHISDSEYVYLTFQDWLVSSIQAVYVNDNIETYYRIFDKYLK